MHKTSRASLSRKAQAFAEKRHDGANPIAGSGKEPTTSQSHVLVERKVRRAKRARKAEANFCS